MSYATCRKIITIPHEKIEVLNSILSFSLNHLFLPLLVSSPPLPMVFEWKYPLIDFVDMIGCILKRLNSRMLSSVSGCIFFVIIVDSF